MSISIFHSYREYACRYVDAYNIQFLWSRVTSHDGHRKSSQNIDTLSGALGTQNTTHPHASVLGEERSCDQPCSPRESNFPPCKQKMPLNAAAGTAVGAAGVSLSSCPPVMLVGEEWGGCRGCAVGSLRRALTVIYGFKVHPEFL